MHAPDSIEIRRLQVRTHIGVPDEERAEAQTLFLTVRMVPSQGFEGLADQISRTVDYHAVALEIQSLATSKPRNLIETLAVETADWLLRNHPLRKVSVTIEKHILPDTECVAVRVVREK
jgi:dihydroneopterin aldolase